MRLRLNSIVSLLLPLIILTVAAGGPIAAQTNPEATDKELIQKLLTRIDQLEASQKQIEEKLEKLTPTPQSVPEAAATVAAAPAPAEPAAPEPTPVVEDQTASGPESHVLGPIQFRGFGDFGYGRANFQQIPPGGFHGSPNSFTTGDFDLFVNSRISEHWSVLGEMLVTSDFGNDFSVEMDRFLVAFKPNDYFQVGLGKFNTALGFYPNAFHRARYFQNATGRPMMFADEDDGGILPVHSVGLTATGKIPSGAAGLHWVAELANGRNMSGGEAQVQNYVDENNGKAVNVSVYAKPEEWHGFQTGFSVYHDTLHLSNLSPSVGETILSGNIVFDGSKFQWINEAAMVRHSIIGESALFRSTTAYTEISHAFGKTRPYFRYEYQNVPDGDPALGLMGPYATFTSGRRNGPSIGVGHHMTNYAVVKLQYELLSQRGSQNTNGLVAQLDVAF